MTSTTQPRQPHTASWWFKTAGTITIWIGVAFALFTIVFILSTGGIDATRFNMPGMLIAAGALFLAAAFFIASKLLADRPVYHDYTEDNEGVDYDLADAR
jgi:drug/metabolite transporter (DMT)-like permease